ncbi:MAG: WG repeat-containing protein [Polyangiaceae bacterium]|nr:WG repeat-containing protein [Myxococcales bacterium]MCB9587255.1 WG repeat-containing protein [Polyangiaceae bacterium]
MATKKKTPRSAKTPQRGTRKTASRSKAKRAPKQAKRVRFGYQRDGEWVIEPRFEAALPFHHGLAAVQLGGRWGYIDPQGNWVLEPQFYHASSFVDGVFAQVVLGQQQLYISRAGKPVFLHRLPASDGLVAARAEGFHAWDAKWGYWDAVTGEPRIPAKFASAEPFFGEFATASIWVPDVGGRHGVIDRRGEWVIEPEFILSKGGHPRGAIVTRKEGDKYLTGVVHPEQGVVIPFAEKNIKPDLSRTQTKWPPRTPEDEALVLTKQELAVEPTADPSKFPFRFYGVGIGDSERQLVYRIHFEAGDARPLVSSVRTALRDAGLRGSCKAEGAFLAVDVSDAYELGMLAEEQLLPALKQLHLQHPIREVTLLTLSDYADSDWQRWSVEQQPEADDGPMFGYE